MPALVEKDNWLIRHCRASKYKNGLVIGMRVPSINRGGTNILLLGPECADAQSHTSGARLPKNQGKNLDESEPKKNLDESEEPTDLTQPQQKEKQHHSDSYF